VYLIDLFVTPPARKQEFPVATQKAKSIASLLLPTLEFPNNMVIVLGGKYLDKKLFVFIEF